MGEEVPSRYAYSPTHALLYSTAQVQDLKTEKGRENLAVLDKTHENKQYESPAREQGRMGRLADLRTC